MLDNNQTKVWGIDTINLNKKTYVLEGPIDAMFLPNAIATAGGDLVSTIKDLPKTNMVIVYDNEKRSHETNKKLEKAIMNGYSVCIFPDNFEQKDINDAIQAGLSPEFIKYIIDKNTYKDLAAKMALTQWSRS
jgi:hypothetical protein